MRLEEALQISKIEAALDGREFGYAFREYNKSNFTPERLIIAFEFGDYAIVYKDTLKVITRNPFAYDDFFSEKIIGFDDWEPVTKI